MIGKYALVRTSDGYIGIVADIDINTGATEVFQGNGLVVIVHVDSLTSVPFKDNASPAYFMELMNSMRFRFKEEERVADLRRNNDTI